MKFKLIILLLIISCSKISTSNKSSCSSNGNIHFMYVNVPCEECAMMIEETLNSNLNIFDYNMVRNKENHILINYCYNSEQTDILFIEKSITDIGLLVNQNLENNLITSNTLCCTSQ